MAEKRTENEICAHAVEMATRAFWMSALAVFGVVALSAFVLFPRQAAQVKGLGGIATAQSAEP